MDIVLNALQGKAFHLSKLTFSFLSDKYDKLLQESVPDLLIKDIDHKILKKTVSLHRNQFQTNEYINSRLLHPSTGTIDHLHAEITANYAFLLGKEAKLSTSECVLVWAAGHLHDIDRSFPEKTITGEEEVRHDPAGYQKFKKKHAANSAKLAKSLMSKTVNREFPGKTELLDELAYLILMHEWGGEKTDGKNLTRPSALIPNTNLNNLADIVRNADSISYFEANILTNWEECGKDRKALSNKVHFMFDRMDSSAQKTMKDKILFSSNHILGITKNRDPDITTIRRIMLKICK